MAVPILDDSGGVACIRVTPEMGTGLSNRSHGRLSGGFLWCNQNMYPLLEQG